MLTATQQPKLQTASKLLMVGFAIAALFSLNTLLEKDGPKSGFDQTANLCRRLRIPNKNWLNRKENHPSSGNCRRDHGRQHSLLF
jgi:hypothetical protein